MKKKTCDDTRDDAFDNTRDIALFTCDGMVETSRHK